MKITDILMEASCQLTISLVRRRTDAGHKGRICEHLVDEISGDSFVFAGSVHKQGSREFVREARSRFEEPSIRLKMNRNSGIYVQEPVEQGLPRLFRQAVDRQGRVESFPVAGGNRCPCQFL